jgi:hypothetical protein
MAIGWPFERNFEAKIEELNPEESSPSLSNNPLVTEYSYEVYGPLKQSLKAPRPARLHTIGLDV